MCRRNHDISPAYIPVASNMRVIPAALLHNGDHLVIVLQRPDEINPDSSAAPCPFYNPKASP